jgi:hypothetical protein
MLLLFDMLLASLSVAYSSAVASIPTALALT